jgi:hypothetical protein
MRIDPQVWLLGAHKAQNDALKALSQAPPDFTAYQRHLDRAAAYSRLVELWRAWSAPVPRPRWGRLLWIFASGVVCAGFWCMVIFAFYEAVQVFSL